MTCPDPNTCTLSARGKRCPSCAAKVRDTPEYRTRLSEGRRRALANPEIKTKAVEVAIQNLAKVDRRKPYVRRQCGNHGLVGEEREMYRALNKRGYRPAEARAMVEAESRRSVQRLAAEMLARHEREKQSRY